MTVKQIETATVIGTIGTSGNATITVTARGMSNSPKAVSVAVTSGDDASAVALKVRNALAYDTDVSTLFLVSGATDKVILTKHIAAANDTTLNIAIANGTCTGLTAAPTSANTLAGTGLSNAYCTLAEIKASDVLNLTNTDHDEILEAVINGVSRLIDNNCGRRFYATTETRYYQAELGDVLFCHDISTATGLTIYTDEDGDGTYENTWAATDYNLLPENSELDSVPYNMIETSNEGAYSFPGTKRGVKITASFGWAATPDPVNRACVLQSVRLLKRYLTPLGTMSMTALGEVRVNIPQALDPDVALLLNAYETL